MTQQTPPNLQSDIPVFKIVPIENLVPHELQDDQRANPLAQRLSQEITLMNPPVVTSLGLGDDRYMLLDGTNRVVAFELLTIPHIIVQVVPYKTPPIELYTWHHTISGISITTLLEKLNAIDELDIVDSDLLHARAALARRAILSYCILSNDRIIMLASGGQDLLKNTDLLCKVVDSYIQTGKLNRTNIADTSQLRSLYPDMVGTFIFPEYETVEVLELAQNSYRVPPGITRHIIHGRALRIHYPIERLASTAMSLTDKNQELNLWLQSKFAEKQVRYYAESTYMFDE